MLMPLAYFYAPWRAHIVRGLLAQHGISTRLCGENGMCLYGPGSALVGTLWIEQEDMAEAVEVLNAMIESPPSDHPPEPLSEETEAEVDPEYQSEPDFPAVFIGFMGMFGILTVSSLVSHLVLAAGTNLVGGSYIWQRYIIHWALNLLGLALVDAVLVGVLLCLLRLAKRGSPVARGLFLICGLLVALAVSLSAA